MLEAPSIQLELSEIRQRIQAAQGRARSVVDEDAFAQDDALTALAEPLRKVVVATKKRDGGSERG